MKASESNLSNIININFFYKYGLYFLFIFLIIIFTILSKDFLTFDNIIYILLLTAPYGITVVGMTFVILTAGIDLSVGSIVFASGVTAIICGNAGFGVLISIFAAIVTGMIVGFINGLLISKWKIVPFLNTLATMMLVRGAALLYSSEGFVVIDDPRFMEVVTQWKLLGIPIIVFVFIIIAALGQIILRKTPIGWHLYAIGNNPMAAQKIGINVNRLTLLVYMICGTLAGLSGFIQVSLVGAVTSNFGTGQEFTIISATVLGGVSLFGGKGKILPGAVIGILIFTIIENALVLISANPYFYTIIRGFVIFLAVMLDSITNRGELR
ncbi:MAG: ABC transporter permease [Spirochaetes bacterium]|nr:ABC transporter permease [Spirochaetota bacterium]